jgi:PadR family transcriptional regulator, regulatory protein PadR
MCSMVTETKLSHTATMILQAVNLGYIYGFTVMEVTGLPSGTVYPALRRLERDDLVVSRLEKQSVADSEQRPPRKYYKLTANGKVTLESARKRYPLLSKLVPSDELERA